MAKSLDTPHRFKKLKEIHSYLSSSGDIDIDLSDVQGAEPTKSKTISSPTDLKPRIEHGCNYLFKELEIDFSNTVDSASLTANIRDFLLKVERWQKQ